MPCSKKESFSTQHTLDIQHSYCEPLLRSNLNCCHAQNNRGSAIRSLHAKRKLSRRQYEYLPVLEAEIFKLLRPSQRQENLTAFLRGQGYTLPYTNQKTQPPSMRAVVLSNYRSTFFLQARLEGFQPQLQKPCPCSYVR